MVGVGAATAALMGLCVPALADVFDEVQFIVEGDGALVLEHTDVHAVVQVGLAVVDVRQLYHNPFDHPIDATYLFPLPPDAAVRSMSFTCGGRRIDSQIETRAAARHRYEAASRAGQKAALLEQHRPNLFQQSVSSLCPGEDVVVELQYIDPLDISDGRTELVFPTTVGPRYKPGAVPEPPMTTIEGHTLSVGVDIAEGLTVDAIWSDTHDLEIVEETEDHLWVKLADEVTLPNKDFQLAWTFTSPSPRLSAAAIPPTADEDGYLAVTLSPGVLEDLEEVRGRELLFVLDESCSMKGEPFAASAAAVRLALENMRPDDTFNLVRFSNTASSLFAEPMPVSSSALVQAEIWLSVFDGGGTEMTAGIVHSLDMPGDPKRLRLVLMLTDGFIGDEEKVLQAVRDHLGEARLFSLGVGSSVNRYLLDALADVGRGDVAYQLEGTPIEETVERFYERIASPALTDVSIDFGDLDVREVYPSTIPDLFVGQPVHVVARWSGEPVETTIRLTGRTGSDEYTISRRLVLQDAAFHEALPTLWARRKLADLERTEREDPARLEKLSTAVALEHHIVSPYTSLIAVADRPSSCGAARQRVAIPSMLPEGYGGSGTAAGLGGLGTKGRGSGRSGYGSGGGHFGAKSEYRVPSHSDAPILLGSIDHRYVDEVVKRHLNQIRYCYQRELQKDPRLAGKVVVQFVIAADGAVSAASMKSTDLGNATVEQCILGHFQRMRFTPPLGGGTVNVSYPFSFSAEPSP